MFCTGQHFPFMSAALWREHTQALKMKRTSLDAAEIKTIGLSRGSQ